MTLSLVSFTIAIYILYCNKEFYGGSDFIYNPDSVVVGSFGLIVTLLVGWQIYKSVEVDRDIDRKINKAVKMLIKETSEKEVETNILSNMQVASVLHQKSKSDSIVTALGFIASGIRKIHRIKNSEMNITEEEYDISNYIEYLNLCLDNKTFDDVSKEVLSLFIEKLDGITGEEKDMKELSRIRISLHEIFFRK